MPPTIESINVFITGFGPFPKFDGHGGLYHHNASHLVTQLLPSSMPPSHPLNPTSHHINLINPTSAEGQYVKVEYKYIRNYVSDLHDAHKDDIDLFLHIGMADGWDFVSIEHRAFKQGFSWGSGCHGEPQPQYMLEDAKGETVRSAPVFPWAASVPVGLTGTLDVEVMVRRANEVLKKPVKDDHESEDSEAADPTEQSSASKAGSLLVKEHHDPGTYCCGFIYYESLANKYVKGTRAHVMFCHVPGEIDKESLEKARNSILAIIGTAAGELLKAKSEELWVL